jgi:hypothetical protein
VSHLVVLAPSFGTTTLPRNLLALYLAQQLRPGDSAHLILYCDDGLIETQQGGEPPLTWEVVGTREWVPLTSKYNVMLTFPRATGDAYVVCDVDDVYCPRHLASHAAALDTHQWSHPSRAWSTYGVDVRHEAPRPKVLAGRHYHGALAIRADLLRILRGWPQTDRSDYDKQQLARCRQVAGPPGDPCSHGPPAYTYRWKDSGFSHISAGIRDGRYPRPRIHETPLAGPLTPAMDASTEAILRWLA